MLRGVSPRRGRGGASLTGQVCATVRYDRPRLVGVRRCLTRRPGRAGNACRWVPRCGDDHGGGGGQRTAGAEAPGSVRKPPEGDWRAPRRPGRSAGCRGCVDQPASAGLGT